MTIATIEGIKLLAPVPQQGYRFLSVNLALVDLSVLSEIARVLGFKPELVQIHYRSGTQVHALLWHGEIEETPVDMDEKVDQLAEQVNTDAIRYATGGWTHHAA